MSGLANGTGSVPAGPGLPGRGRWAGNPGCPPVVRSFPAEENPFETVVADVTHRCNMACANCYLPNRDIPDMDIGRLEECLAALPKRVNLRLIGAEPTMRRDLPDIISMVRRRGHRAVLLTNGLRLARESYVRTLREAGLRHVYVSMNGADNDDWYETIDNMRCAAKKLRAVGNAVAHGMIVNTGTILVRGVLVFYEPGSGAFYIEGLFPHPDPHKRQWVRGRSGWVQDSWPRAMADKCPSVELPTGMRFNEKQTSLRIDELRRQDPAAPIRNFRGSQLTAPGRTGLAASGGRPTTTKEEVDAFLMAEEGNILRWNKRAWVWVRSWDREEVWRIQHEGTSERFFDVARPEDGSRLAVRFPTRDMVYMVGYPFPFLPTGRRHPAFQLTDELVARPHPRELPFMGEAYADKRFVFHAGGKFSVVDEAGNLVKGPHFDGVWRWTRGTLEMTVRDDPTGFRLTHWRTLAHQLGMKPTVWTPSTPDKID